MKCNRLSVTSVFATLCSLLAGLHCIYNTICGNDCRYRWSVSICECFAYASLIKTLELNIVASLLTSATKVDMQVYRIVNNYFFAKVVYKNVIAI